MVLTEITRPKYRRGGRRYESNTTDEAWAVIAPLMPNAGRRGRPRTTVLRPLVNAIFHIAQTGWCQWRRLLPKEFPPDTTVQRYFGRWRDAGTCQKINHDLVMLAREAERREASPTAEVIDSQSDKAAEAGGPRRFDAALLALIRSVFAWLRHVFANSGYAGKKLGGFQALTALLGSRAHHRLAEPQSRPNKGFRGHHRRRPNVARASSPRHHNCAAIMSRIELWARDVTASFIILHCCVLTDPG